MNYTSHKWTTVKGKGELIITGPDKFLMLVDDIGEITLTDASNRLKVPKNVLEEWCDALEAEGVLRTEKTMKDTVLLSNEKHKFKNDYKKSFLRQLKGINGNTRNWEMDLLDKKRKEIEKDIKELDVKTKRLQVYEMHKIENDKVLRSIETREKELRSFKAGLQRHEDKLIRMRQELEKKADDLALREKKVKERLGDVISIAGEFRIHDKALQKERKKIENIEKKLQKKKRLLDHKESEIGFLLKEIFLREEIIRAKEEQVIERAQELDLQKRFIEEQHSVLISRESGILAGVRELSKMADDLSQKEDELEKRDKEMLLPHSAVLDTWGVQEPDINLLMDA